MRSIVKGQMLTLTLRLGLELVFEDGGWDWR